MADIIESREDAIASYPYDSLEEGFGLVSYYLSAVEDVSGTEYRIGKDLNYSSEVTIRRQGGTGTDTKTFYSGTFVRPRTMKGTIKINWCHWAQKHGNDSVYYEVKFYHYDGSTSTQIGSTWTSATETLVTPGVTSVFNAEITGTKKFKAGEQMKIEIIKHYILSSSPGGIVEYGIDPQNRDGINLTPSTDNEAFTQFIVRVPFRLVN